MKSIWHYGLAWALSFAMLGSAHAETLLVAAAASLTNAFKDLASSYEQAHPGTQVLTTFGASDVVLRQILEGAPADLFASADQAAMDQAQAAGVIEAGTRRDFARNTLVLIVPADAPATIRTAQDLRRPEIQRIALGNPRSVPVGRYTLAALQQAGLADLLESRQILGQNVRQVLSYVERGEVDAGFVFATDAAMAADRVRIVQTLDTPTPVVYPVALVARPSLSGAAADFLDYLLSEPGQAILARYHFSRP
ncbi:molybdate ABC transporter substrate-binding protein [Castellaniella sp.]|uniref:molybdate ABC transporter substrate-binding protein n=1 Tax=Castellaniella sp. TaxID=1955812 RepID=UPI00356837E2